MRLLAVFGVALLLALSAFALFGEVLARRTLHHDAVERNRAMAALTVQTVRLHFDGLTAYVESIARRPALVEAVVRRDAAGARGQLEFLRAHHPYIDRAVILLPDGKLWLDSPYAAAVQGGSAAGQPWFAALKSEPHPIITPVVLRKAEPVIYVVLAVAPLTDAQGRVVGYLAAQNTMEDLAKWFSGLHPTPGTTVQLFDQLGQPARATTFMPARLDSIASSALKRALSRLGEATGYLMDGEEGLVTYARVAPYDWAVLIRQSGADALAPMAQLRTSFAVFSTLLFLGLLLLGYGLVRTVARGQQERERLQSLLNGIIDGSPDPISAVGCDLRTLAMNRVSADTAERLFGHRPRIGDSLEQRFGSRRDDLVRLRSYWQRALDGETVLETATFRQQSGAVRSYDMRYYPLYADDGTLLGAAQISRDVTEREETQQHIAALNAELSTRAAELERTNREMEGFSYSVSHDLRAPLRAIDGFCRLLSARLEGRLDEEEQRLFSVVRDSSKSMGRLIDDLLHFAHIGRHPLQLVQVDMRALVDEVWLELAEGFSGEIEIAPLPPAIGDRALLKQVWINLLSNAVKYSKRKDVPRIRVLGERDGERLVYSVADNGAGFDMRYVNKLFGVFQRLHGADEFPGSGVGLAIIERVVSRHGGKVWAEGEVGAGARFWFSLPMTSAGWQADKERGDAEPTTR